MSKVLNLTTSILGESSVSKSLAQTLLQRLQAEGEVFELTNRDFSQTAIPHVDGQWLQALMTPETDRDDEQQAKVDFSNTLIAELKQADVIVITLPMYNFSVPSMLKAWNDHVARAGETFKYTESGSVGLLGDKKVYLVTAMGGKHEPGKSDFLRPYMEHFLGFLGLEDIEFITADGLSMGDAVRAEGLARAEKDIVRAVSRFNARAQQSESVEASGNNVRENKEVAA